MGYGGAYGGGYGGGYGMGGYGWWVRDGRHGYDEPDDDDAVMGRFPMLESAQMIIGGIGAMRRWWAPMHSLSRTHFIFIAHDHAFWTLGRAVVAWYLTPPRRSPGRKLRASVRRGDGNGAQAHATLRWVVGLFSSILAAYAVRRYMRANRVGSCRTVHQ